MFRFCFLLPLLSYLFQLYSSQFHPSSRPCPRPCPGAIYRRRQRGIQGNVRKDHAPAKKGGVPHQASELQDDDGSAGVRAGLQDQIQHPERPPARGCLRTRHEDRRQATAEEETQHHLQGRGRVRMYVRVCICVCMCALVCVARACI